MNDTSPEMRDKYRALIMSRSSDERIQMAYDMFNFARAVIVAGLPPGLSEDQRSRMIYERTYGEPAPWPQKPQAD